VYHDIKQLISNPLLPYKQDDHMTLMQYPL
jgi:hypothetical protein